MSELEKFFNENFVEGKRYDIVLRFAGSCAVLGIPLEDCIEFYNKYRKLDDENRVNLIKRTYDRYEDGLPVLTLKEYGVDVLSYFYVTSIKNKNEDIFNKKIEKLQNKLSSLFRNKNNKIDLDYISVKLDKSIHIKEYFYLLKRRLTIEDINKYNIRVGIGKYKDRIIIPIFNKNIECIYFLGRAINEDIKPKYLNAQIPKTNIIWNYYNCDFNKPVVICEGVFNAIMVEKYLNIQAIAVLGKNISKNQYFMLSRFSNEVIVSLDNDVTLKELEKVINNLKNVGIKNISIMIPSYRKYGKKDLNDLTIKDLRDIFKARHKIYMEV